MIFGNKDESLEYINRTGVYAVILREDNKQFLAVKNYLGDLFLPGGGIERDETHIECLNRELLEEVGVSISITEFIDQAQNYFISSKGVPMMNDGYFYLACILDKISDIIEPGNSVHWIELDDVEQLFHAHQQWAVSEALKRNDNN